MVSRDALSVEDEPTRGGFGRAAGKLQARMIDGTPDVVSRD